MKSFWECDFELESYLQGIPWMLEMRGSFLATSGFYRVFF